MIFREFIENKERIARHRLGLIKKMFELSNMKVKDNLKEGGEDPYLFVLNPEGHMSFDGVRVYSIADQMAFRVQRRFDTHPFGRAYLLNIEQMFDDLSAGKKGMDEVGKEVIKNVVLEVKSFFDRATKAEKDDMPAVNDPLNNAYLRSSGTDYASKVMDLKR